MLIYSYFRYLRDDIIELKKSQINKPNKNDRYYYNLIATLLFSRACNNFKLAVTIDIEVCRINSTAVYEII